jgi:hypothetical protein
LQGFVDEVLKTAKMADHKKKPEDPKGNFHEAHKEVNYIYGGCSTPVATVAATVHLQQLYGDSIVFSTVKT